MVMSEQTPLRFPPRGATPGSAPAPPRRPEPLPKPTGQPPYRLTLASLLPAEEYEQIRSAQHLIFHLVGDVGGVQRPEIQLAVADAEVSPPPSSSPSPCPGGNRHLAPLSGEAARGTILIPGCRAGVEDVGSAGSAAAAGGRRESATGRKP